LLDNATNGTYILNGTNVTSLTEDEQSYYRNKEIGFVFQSFNLLQRSSALENVVLPSIYAGQKKEERERRGAVLLTQVGLGDHIYKKPNQLSGGQQQRVAIARALMNNPNIILADEPTGNLDTKAGIDIMNIVKALNKEGKTIIMITHEKDIAEQAQKIVFIRDGEIRKDGRM
jgi:putative ABC transport system ATP-binding protein